VDGTTTALSDAFDSNVIQPGLSIFSDALAGFNQGNGARQFDNDRAFSVNSGLALAQFSEQTSNVFFDNTSQFLGDVLTRSHEQRQEDIALNGFRAERFRIGNAAAAADFAAIGDTNFIDFQSDAVRFNIASGIAQRDAQELTSLALNIALAPVIVGGGSLFGSRILISGLSGSAANVGAANIIGLFTGESVSIRDQVQAFNTGFIGGAVGAGLGGKTGAAVGGLAAEFTNQAFNKELDLTKLIVSPIAGALTQRVGDVFADRITSNKFTNNIVDKFASTRVSELFDRTQVGLAGSLATARLTGSALEYSVHIVQRTGLGTFGGVASDVTVKGIKRLDNASRTGFDRRQQTIQFQLNNNLSVIPEPSKF
jgi:hypothetical protein